MADRVRHRVKKIHHAHLLSDPRGLRQVRQARLHRLVDHRADRHRVVVLQGHRIYGIDFAGGDVITVAVQAASSTPAKIRDGRPSGQAGIGEVNPTYVSGARRRQGDAQDRDPAYGKSGALFDALQKAYPAGRLEKVGESHIGASIGKEIEWNALLGRRRVDARHPALHRLPL
jgi:hypothetical protein